MQQDAGKLKRTVLENVHSYMWDAMCGLGQRNSTFLVIYKNIYNWDNDGK